MAQQKMTNAYVSLDGNDISAFLESIDLDYSPVTDDATTMGDDTQETVAVAKSWSCSLTAKNDFAASQLDSIMFGIVDALAPVTLLVNPDGSTTSTSNPRYSGSVTVTNYKPLQANWGQLVRTPIALASAGDLSRATS